MKSQLKAAFGHTSPESMVISLRYSCYAWLCLHRLAVCPCRDLEQLCDAHCAGIYTPTSNDLKGFSTGLSTREIAAGHYFNGSISRC